MKQGPALILAGLVAWMVFRPREAAALQVEGVEFLHGLAVAAWNGSAWVEGSVDLQVWEVPELADITVGDGLPLPPPGAALLAPPPAGLPLPFPVLRDEC